MAGFEIWTGSYTLKFGQGVILWNLDRELYFEIWTGSYTLKFGQVVTLWNLDRELYFEIWTGSYTLKFGQGVILWNLDRELYFEIWTGSYTLKFGQGVILWNLDRELYFWYAEVRVVTENDLSVFEFLGCYAADVNILGGNIHTVKEKTEALVVVSKETGLEVNANRTKYLVMSRDQNTGRNHNMKIW